MTLRSIRLKASDVPTCLRFWGGRPGYSETEIERVGPVLERLLDAGWARGVLMKDGAGRPVAHGISVFVDEAFADRFLASPHALPSKRLLLAESQSILQSELEIGRRNAGHGLQMLVVDQGGNDELLTPEAYEAIVGEMVVQFALMHRGYRLARIINELTVDLSIADVGANPAFERYEYCDYTTSAGAPARSLIAVIDRDEAMAKRSLVMPMFLYTPPRVFFTATERKVLAVALDGFVTDPDLADALGASQSSVKASWRRIAQRFEERLPGLLPSRAESEGSGVRGGQIRHFILQYLRDHPEELTPYRQPAETA